MSSLVRVSHRAYIMPASPIRKLVPYADQAKKRGIKVYHLNIGQPDVETPREIFEALKGYEEEVLGYGPSGGLADLRFTLVDYFSKYGVELAVDDIWITTGGSEAIIFSLMTVCDLGDEVLIPEPFYTNYKGFAEMAGVKLVPITTIVEQGFHLPPKEEILDKLNPRTKAIAVCSPNNPTGTVYTQEEMDMVAEIAVEHDLFILSDEVYREFTFDGRTHVSILHLPAVKDRAVVIDSISKRFSACGARVGFVVSRNREFMDSVLKFGQARLCPPTLEQIGAIAGFKAMDRFMGEMVKEYERRRDVVYEEIGKIEGAFTQIPEGAFYTVVKLLVDDSEDFTRWMLTEFHKDGKTTMAAPAEGFYATPGRGKDEVRIAFVLKEEDLRDAMQILGEGLQAYREHQRHKESGEPSQLAATE